METEGPHRRGSPKWILSRADGSKASEDDWRLFVGSMQTDIVRRMKEITAFMQTPEQVLESIGFAPKDIEVLLDELQVYVESTDMANYFHSIGGLVPLLAYLRNSHANIKAKAAKVVSTLVQNNTRRQQLVMEANGLDLLLSNFTSDSDIVVRSKALEAISSLIRDNKPGITAFRLANGYAGLVDALSSENVKFQKKAGQLMYYLRMHEHDCNSFTPHMASTKDSEIRETTLTNPGERSYKHDTTNSTEEDQKLKQISRERVIMRIREIAGKNEGGDRTKWEAKKGGEVEGRSDGHGQQGEQKEMLILVRTGNSVDKGCDDEGRLCYRCVDFHLVDLKGNKIFSNFLPSMYQCVRRGEMMSMGPFIYIIGAAYHEPPLIPEPPHKYHYYMGASRLDLGENSNSWCWERVALPATDRVTPCCVPMFGKMYSFGYPSLNPQVYDPSCDQWKEMSSLPSHLVVGSQVSFPVLSDPANQRILVHLSDSNQLYAFYPPKNLTFDHSSTGGKWECIATGMWLWEEVAAVADDIIYFHSFDFSSNISAYDIAAGKWLDVDWSLTVIDGKDVRRCQFDALFSCPGKGMLWSARWAPDFRIEPIETSICFLKFRVAHTSDSTLTITPLAQQSYHIPSTNKVFDFLPF